jgi:hypothetical protein
VTAHIFPAISQIRFSLTPIRRASIWKGSIGRTVPRAVIAVTPTPARSNSAENYFSIFERGVYGTFHSLSEAHLHRYLAEFDFRYNKIAQSLASRTLSALRPQ